MKISAITFINLQHRTDRLNHILNQLKGCPHNFFKTNAIRPINIDGYNLCSGNKRMLPHQKIGTVGCFLSHKKAITKLLSLTNNPEDYSIILEDDLRINNKIWLVLPHITPLVNNADVLLFDCQNFNTEYRVHNECISKDDYSIIYKPEEKMQPPDFHGTHFVAIQNKKLSKVLYQMSSIDCITGIDMWYLYKSTLVTYCPITNLIERSEFMGSDIKNEV